MKIGNLVKSTLAVAVMFAVSGAYAADKVSMRFANATNQAAKDAAVAMIEVVAKESKGTIDIKHFPDNMLGDDRVAFESTIMGDIDIVLAQPSTLTSFIPDMYI